MAIALGADLYSIGDTNATATLVTTAIAPVGGNLVIAVLDQSGNAPSTATLAGGGVTTWVQEATLTKGFNTIASPGRKLFVWRAQQTSYGSAAAATFTFGTAGSGAACSIFQFSGVTDDTANNGAACLINKVTNASDTGALSGTATLAAATNANNRPVSVFGHVANEVTTPASSWTEIHDVAFNLPINALETQWRSDTFDTAGAASWATSAIWGACAFELVAAIVASTLPPMKLRANYQALNRAANF